MINYNRIKRDCFWDYNFTNKEILELSLSKNTRKRNFLFQKILLNSTNLFSDLKIFDISTLYDLIENYKISDFNHEHAFKRKNMVETYFFNKPVLVNELKWIT